MAKIYYFEIYARADVRVVAPDDMDPAAIKALVERQRESLVLFNGEDGVMAHGGDPFYDDHEPADILFVNDARDQVTDAEVNWYLDEVSADE
jgi:hypothetical protein